ncbi:farnesol dehydrogenase-like isoform X2 [Pseudomyrmex gracilis]|uniref:farnesol dehydrogenase-like isoform X2 n=1 Tax=Pseudomyrmex gracilis TaxID=219809 RepID=UPI000994E758|nr:farnesol dehydrogenase-like isoform X2 [Pseudomyrmex gracilis]
MERWLGKVALVTGASSGIGADIGRTLAINGMKVIAVARRMEKLQELAADVQRKCNAKLHPIRCDVQKEEDILEVFKWAEKHLNGVDVLINNAGVLSTASLSESTENLQKILNVNVLGTAICSRELIQSVKKRKTSGHIINISSITGHIADFLSTNMSIYPASKYAVKGMAMSLRGDLAREKLDVKVTNISPGVVKTDMITNVPSVTMNPMLNDKDISNTVIYILSMPHHVQIWDVIITPFHKALPNHEER